MEGLGFSAVVSLLILNCLISDVKTKEFKLIAFEHAIPNIHRTSGRSEAEKGTTISLKANEMLKLVFCLTDPADVQISGIVLSNDGGSDQISVLLDWDPVGTTYSREESMGGLGWNKFISTGGVGKKRYLEPGRHSITLQVTGSDQYGVEIDYIIVYIADSHLNDDTFSCRVMCFHAITFNQTHGRDTVGSAKLKQKSYRSQCTEESNIRIPFFHDRVTTFSVKATHPQYKAFAFSREPNFTHCEIGLLWKFTNLTYPFEMQTYKMAKAIITHDKNDDHNIVITFFSMDGPRKGLVQSEIGSIVFLQLKNVIEPIDVGLTYYGRDQVWSTPNYVNFNPEKVNHTWFIPDYAWTETPENVIRLLLPLGLNQTFEIDVLSLRERPTKEDTAFKLFDNSEKVIEGVGVDFFWRSDGDMTIRVKETGEVHKGADFFRILTHSPWGTGGTYSQVFVLYRDGHIRILPIAPLGMDWIPFGSSLLLGESNPDAERPYSLITDVEIDMKKNEMKITYANGDTAVIELKIGFDSTTVTIRDVNFKNKGKYPFLVYSSMWASDGNADVDHIRVNGNPPRRIMQGWTDLYGTSIAFYRQCMSKHNTLSPDIRIELLEEQDV